MLLAIDTATNLAGIALLELRADSPSRSGRSDVAGPSLTPDAAPAATPLLRAAYQWQTGRNHTVELMPNIMRLLAETGARADELEAVAVAIGPGSYTGLRIGLSVAKGYCLAHGAALLAVPTLDISAAGATVRAGRLCAVLQAGRGRLAAAFYQAATGEWQRAGELFFGRAAELAEACAGQQDSSLLHQRVGDEKPPTAGQQDSSLLHQRVGDERPPTAGQQDTHLLHQRVGDERPPTAGQQDSSLLHQRVGDERPPTAGQPVYFAGELDADTIAALRARLGELATFAPVGEWKRDPRVLARLGWEQLRQGMQANLETLAPAYGQ